MTNRRSIAVFLAIAASSVAASSGLALRLDDAKPATADIPSDAQFTEVDFTVERGRCYKITADGKWTGSDGKTSGPEGTCPASIYNALGPQPGLSKDDKEKYFEGQNPRNALIGKFGPNTQPFLVGKSLTFISPVTGKLKFRINDDIGGRAARSGKVTLTIEPTQPKWVAANGNVIIRARIDATDYLRINPAGMSWEWAGKWTRVGKHEGTYPTIINEIHWWPEWGDTTISEPLLVRGLCPSDFSRLRIISAKSNRGTVTQIPQPNMIALQFQDNGLGSSEVGVSFNVPVPKDDGDPQMVFLRDVDDAQARTKQDPKPAAKTPPRRSGPGQPIDFPVSVAARDPNFKPSPPPADLNAVERPDYQTQPKALVKSLASATALMVITGEDGSATGFTQDIIATVDADSRKENAAGIRILRADGDSTMKTALEEAVRAVRMRYPIWEPGYIDLSFGEKHNRHGGPSAGTAFAMLMLSCLEGFELDPKCAVTGDITVDWKVRKVGGVTAKVRGAALDKALYAAIPEANESVISDLAILHGNSAVAEIQIFSIATLQDALAIGKKEKDPKLAEAIKRFTELQPSLAKFEKLTLQKAETKAALKKILELAPNHLSARHLLAVAEGKAPKNLSVTATIYKLHATMYPYYVLLSSDNKISRSTLPELMTATARKSFNTLRPIAHKDLLPLLTDQSAFIEAMDVFAQKPSSSSWEALKTRWGTLQARFAELRTDKEITESLRREGF
jgi:hypothetical protein